MFLLPKLYALVLQIWNMFRNATNTSYSLVHNTGTSGQSVKEMASTSSCERSLNVLNENNADKEMSILSLVIRVIREAYNFLSWANLVFIWFFIYQLIISYLCMQSLCNLRHFRDNFLIEPLVWIPSADNICIAQHFYEIFTSWEKNDYHLTDVVLTYMKTLLCGVDCTIFSEKVCTLITITIVLLIFY
jgi:hypothetical protein